MWKSKLKNKTNKKQTLFFKAYISLHKATNKTMEHKKRTESYRALLFTFIFYITRNDSVSLLIFYWSLFVTVLSVKLRELNDVTDATIQQHFIR